MGNGDPVTQKQFYDTMNGTKTEILNAVATVNGHVQENSVKLGVVETKLDTHEKRMDAQDVKIENQKVWNRGLASIEVALAGLLAYLGIRGD